MFIIAIIIFIPITQQPEQDRLEENQPTAGLSSLNKYENEYENEMRNSGTELLALFYFPSKIPSKICDGIWWYVLPQKPHFPHCEPPRNSSKVESISRQQAMDH